MLKEYGKEYCEWFNEVLNNENILDTSFFSDEAWFHRSGYVFLQNNTICSAENPHVIIKTSLHHQKIGVWLATSRKRSISPTFFHQNIDANTKFDLNSFIEQLHDD